MSDRIRGKPSLPEVEASSAEAADRTAGSTSSATSPSLKPKGAKLRKNKSRPQVKRLMSGMQNKLIYSVDDDIHDELEDNEDAKDLTKTEKKYLEGYHDALRRLQQKRNKLLDRGRKKVVVEVDEEPERAGLNQILDSVASQSDEISDDESDALDDTGLGEGNDSDNESTQTTSLKDTIESLNLKDRQEAINTTHPFGIKIWKPSIYKKNRSVALRADEDIHARRPAGKISWGVHLTNFIWCCTFGLFLYFLCLFGAVFVFLMSGLGWTKNLKLYARMLLQLGRFWLYPFRKFVLLNKDENYLEEDELDGRSISEFHRWRLQEEGRLFFAPPRRMTNAESKPLLKDHKGRPWKDAYSSLGEDGQSAENENAVDENNDGDSPELDNNDIKVRFFGRGNWSVGRIWFYIFFYGILQPILYVILVLGWLFVFTIPMANIINILCDHLRRRPLALHFELESDYYKKVADPKLRNFYKNQSIILCTYRCCGFHYYKYTIDGTNIFFINLLLVVVFVILDYFLLKETLGWDEWYTDASFLFCGCLFSIIPLAYFIGQAVASISAQSSMGLGAVINAFFSTVVEIFLYCVALNQSKGKLVEGSMIGSILGGVLLLPGLSMCGGALKRKTQRYNPRSAGVSSTMLLFAMVTMFAPSLFYQMYGSYEIRCKECSSTLVDKIADCTTCRFIQPSLTLDKLYTAVLRPFSLIVAVILFVAYVCGLFFTLRTHASLIWATNSHEQAAAQVRKDSILGTPLKSPSIKSIDNIPLLKGKTLDLTSKKQAVPTTVLQDINKGKTPLTPKINARATSPIQTKDTEPSAESGEEAGGHDAPNWSNNKSTVILLGATILYAIIAEILVDNVDAVLSNFPINPKFLGLTVFALVPNTTEFVNAISFAVGGNVALSMEIGSAYALQVVLIQIPSLVIFSVLKGFTNVEQIFSLIFPRWDIVATLVSIYLFTYIYAEGKSNYFKGVILILIYVVVLVGFYLDDVVADLDDGFGGPTSRMLAQLLSR